MAQVLKPEIRSRIVRAATSEFATNGYAGTSMAAIARRAALSAGNLYRYFEHKSALFQSVVDPKFVARFEALLEARVAALSTLTDLTHLDPEATVRQAEMLTFWFANRERVVILLDRAEGTSYHSFGHAFVARLVTLAMADLEEQSPRDLPPQTRFVLTTIFDGTRRSLVAILEHKHTAGVPLLVQISRPEAPPGAPRLPWHQDSFPWPTQAMAVGQSGFLRPSWVCSGSSRAWVQGSRRARRPTASPTSPPNTASVERYATVPAS